MDEQPKDPSSLVRWPGALLVAAGVAQLAWTVVSTVLVTAFGPLLEEYLEQALPVFQQSGATDPFSPLNMAMTAVAVLLAALALVGGLQMMRLRSWKLALTGAIAVMVPCTGPCCGLFLPAGIWALVVLLRDDVKSAMSSGS